MADKMNILLIGAGGREHALARALKNSASTGALYCSPGSDGIAQEATCIALEDNQAIIQFCHNNDIHLVVIGPEQPLVDGLADALRIANINVFGPSSKAAQLEASKDFTKQLCSRYQIPTARHVTFHDVVSAIAYINTVGAPVVIKADGLAAGKGVTIAQSVAEAEDAVRECFDGKFGEAGYTVVIEECLIGEEVSFFALSDGKRVVPFASAQDHKRAFDGDTGPNTGGMGTYSPAPVFTAELETQVMREIITPAIDGLAKDGWPYVGVLFAGLMLTKDGPKLIEFNCRFGDPEAQVILPRFKGDLTELLMDCAQGTLAHDETYEFDDNAALCVVMATEGYPGSYAKGSLINNIEAAETSEGASVLHAGTKRTGDAWLANGGRVLNVVGTGSTLKDAHQNAYEAVKKINWKKGFYRSDIGWRALEKNS